MKTLYDVLDVTTDAEQSEIRHQYRQLKALYDDELGTYGLLDAEDRAQTAQEVESAYAVLGEPQERARYDAGLRAEGHPGPWQAPPAPPAPPPVPEPPVSGPGAPAAGQAPPSTAGRESAPRPASQQATLKLEPREGQPMDGTFLRSVREMRGLELDALSAALKITVTQLENIEQHRFEKLPAPVYLRGFLRSYGRHIGIDADRLVDEYMRVRQAWEEG